MFTRFVIFAIVLVSMIWIQSCGIFETRDAEQPESGAGASFIQPDLPELVITNLENAVASMNAVNYMRCIVFESFEFTPSGGAQESNPDLWVNWSAEEEQVYFNNMRAATQNLSGHGLQTSNQDRTSLPDGGERISADYSITVIHNRTGDGTPTVASGRFVLDMVQGEDGLWSIQSWTDNAAGSSFTWSDFRATFFRD